MTDPAGVDRAGVDRATLGWDSGWAGVFSALPGRAARVTRVDRGRLRALDGDRAVAMPPPRTPPLPVTGDWIAYDDGEGGPALAAVAPRRTALTRLDPAADAPERSATARAGHTPRAQILAANMDEVWVLHAVDQPLRASWLDRALVVAHGSGADVVVVVSKSDLPAAVDVARRITALAPDVTVRPASAVAGHGAADLAGRLRDGHCAVLLGRSGSGKSSLVNALAGGATHRTHELRAGDARGRHTTTRRSLTPVAGGTVIDTPGVRALGLWEPARGLALTFPDIAAFAVACHFADCGHQHEPKCEVQAAVADNRLDIDRYRRYVTLSS